MTRGARLTDAEADIRTQVVQLSWIAFTSTPKSEASQRTITLDADTVKVLRGWEKFQNQARLQAGPEWVDSGLVFTRQDGQRCLPWHVRTGSPGSPGQPGYHRSHCTGSVTGLVGV